MVWKVLLIYLNSLISRAFEKSVDRAVLVAMKNDVLPEVIVGTLGILLDLGIKEKFLRLNLAVPPYHITLTSLLDGVFYADVEQAVAYLVITVLHRWRCEST